MHRAWLKQIPLRQNQFAGWAPKIHRTLLLLFLLQFAFVCIRFWMPKSPLSHALWPDGLLLLLAVATLLAGLNCQLPGQSVTLAAILIALIAGAVQTLGALTAIPFGPYVYTVNIGQQLFHPLPWTVPFLWVAAILASRGVARLILRPWRKTQTYGFRLIALTTLLVLLLDLSFEPFATRVKHYWLWNATRLPLDWYTTPCTNLLGWTVTTLLILAFVTPFLINKKPMAPPPPDYSPLVIWLGFNCLFAIGVALHHLWPALALTSSITLLVAFLAFRGARW